ncbi:hypothetical protein [Streptomyces sp. NBC_01304]|nr:hypothetical protein OG430_04080 [Streptomyces sp. NBC_01304]
MANMYQDSRNWRLVKRAHTNAAGCGTDSTVTVAGASGLLAASVQ